MGAWVTFASFLLPPAFSGAAARTEYDNLFDAVPGGGDPSAVLRLRYQG